jgi:hypothetical protein
MYTYIYEALLIGMSEKVKVRLHLRLEIKAKSLREAFLYFQMEREKCFPEYLAKKECIIPKQ